MPKTSLSLDSKYIKLSTEVEGIKITVLNCYENKLSKDLRYSIPYLKTMKVHIIKNGDYSYNNDILVYCYNFIIFLKKYCIVFPQSDLFIISGFNEFENASWNGSYMLVGNGFTGSSKALCSPCIIGHELFHCVIQNQNDLDYFGESGSLNEFYADLFGIMFERYIFFHRCNSIGFEIGSELFKDNHSFRSYIDPHINGMPCSISDSLFYKGENDKQGVHHNATVIGHLFYQMQLHEDKKNIFLLFISVFHKLKHNSNFMDFKILILNEIPQFNFLEEPKLINIINSIL